MDKNIIADRIAFLHTQKLVGKNTSKGEVSLIKVTDAERAFKAAIFDAIKETETAAEKRMAACGDDYSLLEDEFNDLEESHEKALKQIESLKNLCQASFGAGVGAKIQSRSLDDIVEAWEKSGIRQEMEKALA